MRQLTAGPSHPSLHYIAQTAERSALAVCSIDLICVAQALHWFDLQRFFDECSRVLRPNGVLAVWSYGVQHIDDAQCDEIIQHFYHNTVGPYWPPERAWVEQAYAELQLPGTAIPSPALGMTADWSRDALLGYFSSWSAVKRYRDERKADPLRELEQILCECWPDANQQRRITWPLSIFASKP